MVRTTGKRPSINDVALMAGVSKSTVSHVINNTRFVEELTKQNVLRVIDQLGYRPSQAARSLTTNRTQMIGVIVSDISNYFFGEVFRGIETVFGSLNYGLVVCNTSEILEREEHYINLLLSQQVDGIIAAATSQQWHALDRADMVHTPLVLVDREYEGMHDRPYVGADNFAGAYAGTKHLITCGHEAIGVLAGFQRLSAMRERLAGFRSAMADAGLPVREDWIVPSSLGVEQGKQAALSLLDRPDRPRALFVNNNYLSLGAMLALKQMGLDCPKDIALVGFDDHPWAAVAKPPLTVIRQPSVAIGERAAQAMIALLNNQELQQPRVLLECELVIRESCGWKQSHGDA